MQSSAEVSGGLREIAALLIFAGAPKFKVTAYARAADVVDTVGEIGPLVAQDRLSELEGIGPALSAQIRELWQTGRSQLLERLRSEQPAGAAELVQLAGMTPRRIRLLHEALGIGSVEDLRAACLGERVRGVRGFGKKTEAQLLAACERWLERGPAQPAPILLAQALERAASIEQALLAEVEQAHFVGALRRGEETVRELSFVVVGDAARALQRVSEQRQVLRADAETLTAQLSQGLSLELHETASSALGNALVAHTGNAQHVAAVQERAQACGISLNLGGGESTAPAAGPAADAASFESEAALYAALGLAFIPPELRTGQAELEQAERADFSELVTLADVRGMVHCHTLYSDGKNSILEMARAAHALGMSYITITDHSPSAHYANGLALDRLKEQWDEIAAAQAEVPIRILRGTEADILADGSLDFPDEILEKFEVVIASIHARHRMDREAMTRRLQRALALPVFKIWGHALGRILNHREPFECDVLAVLDTLAEAKGAIELNSDPHRLDLPPQWIPAARERGIPFVISVDAHSLGGFDVLRYGVTMARRGGVNKAEVLNTSDAASFAARVRPV
jgi:DNA polymerase (family 10)